MDYYFLVLVCIIGVCLGSFYNVVIIRSLSGESIVFPPSKCPKCGHKLAIWHNIPIVSYILLRGKCYFCKERISIQYPVIEFVTMVLFGLIFLKYGLSLLALFALIWVSCLIIMTATDIKEKVVDCKFAIILAVSAVLFWTLSSGWKGLVFSLLGLVIGAFIVEIFARLGYLVAETRAMGEGDTYVAGALGAMGGIVGIIPILLYSVIASMIFIIPAFLVRRYKIGDKFTCISAILFILSVVIYKSFSQNYFSLFLLILFGILLGYFVLRGIKKQENKSYFPFVPALALGALYFLLI